MEQLTTISPALVLPVLIATAYDCAQRRFLEFFVVTIRNAHTRRTYARADAAADAVIQNLEYNTAFWPNPINIGIQKLRVDIANEKACFDYLMPDRSHNKYVFKPDGCTQEYLVERAEIVSGDVNFIKSRTPDSIIAYQSAMNKD